MLDYIPPINGQVRIILIELIRNLVMANCILTDSPIW